MSKAQSTFARTIDPADIVIDDNYNAGHAAVTFAIAVGDEAELASAREYGVRFAALPMADRARVATFAYGIADALAGKRDYRFGN